jgi:RNA polymerase sigma factor (sigma-70 family)
MVAQISGTETFTDFVVASESKLRQSLMAAFGGEVGRDAAADALEYGWEHWNRVSAMENPVGYLYAVGRSRALKELGRVQPVFDPVDVARAPEVEPKLPSALAALSERQRTVVLLVHGYGWTQIEVAELLGLSRSSVRNHLERGLAALRGVIGDLM